MSSIISNRVQSLSESQSLKMSQLCAQLRAEGHDVISLTLGEPDATPPPVVNEAVTKALSEYAYSHYGPVAGMLSLRKAISRKLEQENQLNYQPEQIVVSVGAKQAIFNVILSLINPGDEVVIPTPCWVSYSEMVTLAEGKCVFVPTSPESKYKMSARQLEQAITDKTKLLLICSPNNPTGSVYSHEEFAAIAEVLSRHPEVFVIADEIYEHINYVGQHCSLASFPEIEDRVVIINGVSKAYAMTGYRLGWMASHCMPLVKACLKLQGQSVTHATMLAQCAAEAAYLDSPDYVNQLRKGFAERKQVVMQMLGNIPGITCVEPDGAFYAFPDVSSYYGKSYVSNPANSSNSSDISDSTTPANSSDKSNQATPANTTVISTSADMVNYLLSEAHVACVAGSAFGEDKCIRLSFATDIPSIREALTRIHNALLRLA